MSIVKTKCINLDCIIVAEGQKCLTQITKSELTNCSNIKTVQNIPKTYNDKHYTCTQYEG